MNITRLKKKIQEKSLTLYELSIKSEVPYSTLHDIITGKAKNPRIDTITKIANALEEKVESLI
ncbi:transcriptional regulator [Clostridium botulinum]